MRIFPVLPAAMFAGLGIAAPALAWADSPVQIEGAEREVREAVLDLLPDRDRPTTLFEAERIAEEAAVRAMAWLRSEGYYAAQVTPEASEEPPAARLIIAPGVRFRFAAPQVSFTDTAAADSAHAVAEAAAALIEPDAPARAEAVLAAEGAALAALQNAGYPDATTAERRVIVDHADARVSTELRYTTGAFARLGGVRAAPDTILRAGFVDDLQNWEPGAPYTPDQLARLRRDLTSTGAISRASTRLDPPNAEGVRDVVVEIEAARRHAYELGLSYSTTEGAGIVAQWTRRNLTGRADPLTIAASLSELQQGASAELTRPHAAGLGHAIKYGAAISREDIEAYTREGAAIYASIDASPRLRLGRSFGLRLSADRYEDAGAISDAIVLSGFGDIRYDTTQNAFDPRRGVIAQARLEPSVSTGDATLGFVRATAEGRAYHSFGESERVTLAARLRAGWLEAVAGDAEDVPPDRRFYAGGGGSVRGYEYNSIYPGERVLDANAAPGGQGLLETSLEARWRFGNAWGAAAFIDGGNAFDTWGDAGDMRWGAGFGVRYNLGFAPLRVDIAFPLNERETRDSYALYISLGQAF